MVVKRRKAHRAIKKKPSQLSAKRRAELSSKAKKLASTIKSPLRVYREIEKKIDTSWKKLRNAIKTGSRLAILKGRQELLLLLGECNYMTRECKRCLKQKNPHVAVLKN